MNRRDFIKNSCGLACACVGISAISLLQSCEDNKAYEQNTNEGGGTPDSDNQLVINLQDTQYQSLNNVGGTAVMSSNSIDSLGLLLIRSSETQIKAFSRRCTHSSYRVNAFNSQGLAGVALAMEVVLTQTDKLLLVLLVQTLLLITQL